MSKYQHILIAADLDPEDDDPVTQKGKAIAEAAGAKVSLIHVVDLIYTYAGPEGAMTLAAWQTERDEQAQKEMTKLASKLGVDAANTHVVEGLPKDAIVHKAEDIGADLIVMGRHRRTGIQRLILGSTAQAVLHSAPCDVLVVQVNGD